MVELDPDADPSVLVNGQFENTAFATGMNPDNMFVMDTSDDPGIATDVDPNSDGNPDDPTLYGLSDITAEKSVSSFTDAASGTLGNFDVTYSFTVTNTGSEDLTNLSLVDDWAAQFGGAFVGVIPGTVTVTNVDATTAPGANTTYAGGATENLLDGTGLLESGQSYTVSVTVEVDPDNATANLNASGQLENQATASGLDQGGDTVSDLTDDPNDTTNADPNNDNNPDDPTAFSFASIEVTKAAGTPTPAASGVSGNFDVEYTFVVTNDGVETVSYTHLTLPTNREV